MSFQPITPNIRFTHQLLPAECKKYNEKFARDIRQRLRPKMLFLNEKQSKFLFAPQKTKLMLGGRGSAKTRSGIGYGSAVRVQKLPRTRLFLASMTFGHILKNLMGEISDAWAAIGWEEGRDYVKWVKPPKHFALPLKKPELWKYSISFRNGTVIDLLSLDRPELIRGMSYDGGDWDEFAQSDVTDWQDVVLPTLRGNIDLFHGHLWHQNVNLFTSIPRTPKGFHIFDLEKLAQSDPNEFFFIETNVYDNIHFWGEKGIERLKKSMSFLRFRIEVLNERIRKVEKAFYHAFDPNRSVTTFRLEYGFDATGHLVKGFKDLNRKLPLLVSYDFGGWFTGCIVAQYDGATNILRIFKEFFRNGSDLLSNLIAEMCQFFNGYGHIFKRMCVYGEPAGWNPRTDAPPTFQKVIEYTHLQGWEAAVMIPPGYRVMDHLIRHEVMNEVFAGQKVSLPTILINEEGCPNLVLALQNSEITPEGKGYKGYEKNRDMDQAIFGRHLPDCLDYLVEQGFTNEQTHVHRASSAGTL